MKIVWRDSVSDDELETSEEEEVVSNDTKWGETVILPCKPIGI
jgi:hypothetical protein